MSSPLQLAAMVVESKECLHKLFFLKETLNIALPGVGGGGI